MSGKDIVGRAGKLLKQLSGGGGLLLLGGGLFYGVKV